MIVGVLLRNYKNYANINFIPVANNENNMFSIYTGNNGVGKSAVLEAIGLLFSNKKQWNITQGTKRNEAFICPIFLIPKSSIPRSDRTDFETVSSYFWSDSPDKLPNVKKTTALQSFIDYKNSLKKEYGKNHYLILIGIDSYSTDGYFATFNKEVLCLLGNEDEQVVRATRIIDTILSLYTYLYIPVEESPSNLLNLQSMTMQKFLNTDVQNAIERILKQNQEGGSIVSRINKNLDDYIKEVNKVISSIDSAYSFSSGPNNRKNLTAKDIREQIIAAFFPLRSLKVNSRSIEQLSSGEQRKAIIDIAYSTLIANKGSKTEREIILAIDEPELSMHISNCFDQFSRLEDLAEKGVQVLVTTHWYGYLPIAKKGNMHYLETTETGTSIQSFDLYGLLENRGQFPDDVELKSIFDLASSLITYMRRNNDRKWIFCEGVDDKLYLETILNDYSSVHIVPLGGCGNVIKLFNTMYGFMSEKSEEADSDMLFLIDTDKERIPVSESTNERANRRMLLRRLQLEGDSINLRDPSKGGMYSQTEIEDCLDPSAYYSSLNAVIQSRGSKSLKEVWKNYKLKQEARTSRIRGDDSCIRCTDVKYIDKKNLIVDFVEKDNIKYEVALEYSKRSKSLGNIHQLETLIVNTLNLK